MLIALMASVVPQCALAKWPDRPVRLILPYGPGGVADVPARILAEKLTENLGQRFMVENMPGPGDINASRAVLSAAPDGYTLGFVTNGNAIAPVMFANLPYDPGKQFRMISQVGEFTLAFAVNSKSPYQTVADLISFARAHPGKLNVGTVSVGSTQNFSAELFKSMTGLDFQIVLFKTSPDLVVALLMTLLPGCILAGIGLGLTNTTVSNTTTAALPPERAGMASGMDMSARMISLAVNIALMGFILASGVSDYILQARRSRRPKSLCGRWRMRFQEEISLPQKVRDFPSPQRAMRSPMASAGSRSTARSLPSRSRC